MKKNEKTSSVETRIIQGLQEFTQGLESGDPIEKKFTVRRVVPKPKTKRYHPSKVKKARRLLGADQTVFALFLGVSPKTVQAWEKGLKFPNRMACRFLEEIQKEPAFYRLRLQEMGKVNQKSNA